MALKTIVQAVNEAMDQVMQQDPTVMVLGLDVGTNGGVFRATEKLLEKHGENRVVDTPLAESAIVGSAIGLAVNGFKPIVELQFMGFIYSAMDQICSQAARTRFRSGGRFTAPMVIRGPFGGGVHALELHCDSYESFFTHTPGLKVVIPSNPYDAKGLLISAVKDPDPVIFFEPMRIYRSVKEEVPDEMFEVPLGKANVVREGEDITIISWGAPVQTAVKLAEQLEKERNLSIEVVDLRTLVPFDSETVMNSARKTGRVIVMHEAVKTGGFGAEVASRVMEEAFTYLECPVERVTGFDTPYPFPQVEHEWMPNENRLIKAVDKVLTY
ncbi:alpha-ketoacid dehydrogenase subunit beta [Cytobacillus depressus]|uniref:Alpha-ketoacid dehydrogenase subunit beta n=1 Tax=Cytobacillus depressus TaxID=1602942 RepID=A0A6L3V6D0_9BACI|nr:alpha-ketoacid dehydrogenase subunit beta [Cytobacillus depressus]KAB2330475.1 alpha-ketoacid dehydrogenase subunit beta [Cytobacillus depressus]